MLAVSSSAGAFPGRWAGCRMRWRQRVVASATATSLWPHSASPSASF